MPITKYVDRVGFVVIANTTHDIAIIAESNTTLISLLMQHYDPKIHNAALIVRFENSPYCYIAYNTSDIEMHNIRDPHTGKYLIKYTSDMYVANAACKVRSKDEED